MSDAIEQGKTARRPEGHPLARCPVNMFNLGLCRRPLHAAGSTPQLPFPVCIMHSRDPHKSIAAFEQEFERTLAKAEGGVANFSGFVFPAANYSKRRFSVKCIFNQAIFAAPADFSGVIFEEPSIFSEAIFLQQANYLGSTFLKEGVFAWAQFRAASTFMAARFLGEARFQEAQFGQMADFRAISFNDNVLFNSALFKGDVFFNVMRPSSPGGTGPLPKTHSGPTRWPFLPTVFARRADFREATFRERAEFRQTHFRNDSSGEPGPVFSSARFDKPSLVVFYKTDLGQALFHNCEVSEFRFENVRWPRRANGKCFAFDEAGALKLNQEATIPLMPEPDSPDERNYGLIAELYQRLKKNYDERKDYWTAGDFHYGEMEMKRLATPQPNLVTQWLRRARGVGRRFEPFRRAWHRRLGLAAWYKYASEYGESYTRPVLWLCAVLLVFAFVYPVFGLHTTTKPPRDSELSYTTVVRGGSRVPSGQRVTFPSLLGHSVLTSIGVAVFQHDLTYEPSYPWGRLTSIAEMLLTSTLVALFLLAVRRQFRR